MTALVDELRAGIPAYDVTADGIELHDIDAAETLMSAAAAELTTLQSRLEEKEAAWEETRKAVAMLNNENGQLRSRLGAVEAERDHWREYSSGQGKLIESGVFVKNEEYIDLYQRAKAAEARLEELQKALNRCKDMNSRLRFPDNTGQ